MDDINENGTTEVVADDPPATDLPDNSVFEAKIAELTETVTTLQNQLQEQKLRNYDLLSMVPQNASDDTGVIAEGDDEPNIDVMPDDLFK